MTQKYQVIVTDFITGDLAPEKKILGDLAEITAFDAYDEKELIGKIEHADAIMLYHNLSLSRSTIERLKQCKLIVRCGVGYDNVDRQFARERGIPVANVPDYGTEEVADSAIGLTLALTRGIAYLNTYLQQHPESHWTYTPVAPLNRLRGRTFGLLGLGRIGIATALRAKALGMEVIFFDPYLADGMDKALGIRRVSTFDELLRSSHVLSIHCPRTPETQGMVNREAMLKLRRGSYLVNTARGAIVETAAIPELIASGHLAGAGIDVLAVEPPHADDPLLVAWRDPKHPCHQRVIVNPHSAFYSEEGLLDMRLKGSQACRNALLGERLLNLVN